jgi:hypothetical protein
MLSAAFMDAAQAAQPDPLIAAMCKVGRQLALVEGGVPHPLNDLVVRVLSGCDSIVFPLSLYPTPAPNEQIGWCLSRCLKWARLSPVKAGNGSIFAGNIVFGRFWTQGGTYKQRLGDRAENHMRPWMAQC